MSIKTWIVGEQVDAADLNNNFAQTLQTQNYTAGETITADDAVYLKASDGKVYKADADADESLNNFIGIALEGGNADDTIMVQTEGLVTGLSGLTAGSFYYVSSVAGGLSATESKIKIGLAISTTTLLLTKGAGGLSSIIEVFDANGTYTKKTGAKVVEVICIGAGGGGGKGCVTSSSSSANRHGGTGGGGGSITRKIMRASDLEATIAVTVGAGGAGATVNDGGDGGNSSFGVHLSAYGGGGGAVGGDDQGSSGGSGGGTGGAGGTGQGDSDTVGGIPRPATIIDAIAGQGAPALKSSAGKNSEFGGASGGGASGSDSGTAGGSSLFAGPGGGSGGGKYFNNTDWFAGGAGGAINSYAAGGGGAGGATEGAVGTKWLSLLTRKCPI